MAAMVKTCAKMALVGTALVLGGLLTACTSPGTPSATTTSSAAAPTTTSAASTSTSTSRNLALPPGVGPFPSSVCLANNYSQLLVNALTVYYDQAKQGGAISDAGWQDMQTQLPQFISRVTPQKDKLVQAGVPASHPIYHDTDELIVSMNAVLDAAKAKDSSALIPAFERLRTANQNFAESCGAITRG